MIKSHSFYWSMPKLLKLIERKLEESERTLIFQDYEAANTLKPKKVYNLSEKGNSISKYPSAETSFRDVKFYHPRKMFCHLQNNWICFAVFFVNGLEYAFFVSFAVYFKAQKNLLVWILTMYSDKKFLFSFRSISSCVQKIHSALKPKKNRIRISLDSLSIPFLFRKMWNFGRIHLTTS